MNAVVPRRMNGAFNLRFRRPVGTHRVQGYDAWHGVARLTRFLNVEDFAALVVPTLWAGMVGHLALVAVRTLGERMAGQKVVSAPRAGALL